MAKVAKKGKYKNLTENQAPDPLTNNHDMKPRRVVGLYVINIYSHIPKGYHD